VGHRIDAPFKPKGFSISSSSPALFLVETTVTTSATATAVRTYLVVVTGSAHFDARPKVGEVFPVTSGVDEGVSNHSMLLHLNLPTRLIDLRVQSFLLRDYQTTCGWAKVFLKALVE
jgi:hypothetical protein